VKIVVDTNVLLAGVATHGLCEGLLAIAFRDHTVLLSEHILAEFEEHYTSKFKATAEQASEAVNLLRSQCTIVSPAETPPETLRDQDDLPVLGTALAARADCLVSGDRELLELGNYMQIPILSPRALYELLRG
jgi:putative PIN family toxin of toxin-antitoxin system